jgi:hypothetical protein
VSRSQHAHHHEHPPKHKRSLSGNRPLRTRLLAWTVVAVLVFASFVIVFDRKDLPGQVRDNAYVAKIYKERDAAITATSAMLDRHMKKDEPADANAEMKQQGYNKDDRAGLNAIITTSGGKDK